MTELGYLLLVAGVIWAAYQWISRPKQSPPSTSKTEDWKLVAHSQLDSLIAAFESNKIETQELRLAGKRLYDKTGAK